MKIAYREEYAHPLPENHRFPMEKYALLPQQLLLENTIENEDIFSPGPLHQGLLSYVHEDDYIRKLNTLTLSRHEERKTGFPLSSELVHRELIIAEGTRRCCSYALEEGVAMNIAGGTHHAYPDHGEGFCLYNDQAIAAFWLLEKCNIKKIMIIDLDVHQGNGSAFIFQNEPRVFTLSLHGASNYPLKKKKSDLDIAWPDGTEDVAYLDWLDKNLPLLVEREQPEFIFYQSGVDVLKEDQLGRLALTRAGCKERDRIVWTTCKKHELPVVACMGGGYAPNIKEIIEAHANTYRTAKDIMT